MTLACLVSLIFARNCRIGATLLHACSVIRVAAFSECDSLLLLQVNYAADYILLAHCSCSHWRWCLLGIKIHVSLLINKKNLFTLDV